MPVSKCFGYRHKYFYEAVGMIRKVHNRFRYLPTDNLQTVTLAFPVSVPAVQNIFDNLLFGFAFLFLLCAEVIVFLAGGVVRIIKIIIAFVIAAVVITVAVITGKREKADYGMRSEAGTGHPVSKNRCIKRKHMTIS